MLFINSYALDLCTFLSALLCLFPIAPFSFCAFNAQHSNVVWPFYTATLLQFWQHWKCINIWPRLCLFFLPFHIWCYTCSRIRKEIMQLPSFLPRCVVVLQHLRIPLIPTFTNCSRRKSYQCTWFIVRYLTFCCPTSLLSLFACYSIGIFESISLKYASYIFLLFLYSSEQWVPKFTALIWFECGFTH